MFLFQEVEVSYEERIKPINLLVPDAEILYL